MADFEEINGILKKYGQDHILNSYNELTDNEKKILLKQISAINFKQVKNLFDNKVDKVSEKDITPIEYIDESKLNEEEIDEYSTIGGKIVEEGKYAVVTMAGGQGTRLGYPGPKGAFVIHANPDKSLFQILCESLKVAKEKYNKYIYWYVMTSRENNSDTINFFEENKYFDYPKKYIKFFIQGELPMLDVNGKILMETKGKVKEAADGHGGIFEAMDKNGIVDDMIQKGIKWIYVGGVDNVLSKMVDTVLLGVAEKSNKLIIGKSLVKACPEEKVGVFCRKAGRPSVVEYTEISKEMSEMRDENGELVYGEAHILCNLFNIEALKKIQHDKLQYHAAFKKADYIDENGKKVIATQPNAFKFESFIFDAFEMVEDMLILRVKREEEFAPLKNKEGVDSIQTATELYNNYWNNNKIV